MPTEQDEDYCHNKDTLLIDDMESTNAAENTEKNKNSSNSSTTMISNIKQAMVVNISLIGNTLKRMHADTA